MSAPMHHPRLINSLAALAILAGATCPSVAYALEKRQAVDVAALLLRMPAEVFDDTTEGIEAEELAILRSRGQSENWKIKLRTPAKVIIEAKRPFSEINLRPASEGSTTFVEALTFNEKAINYSYWIASGPSGPLQAHKPSAVFRLLNERDDGRAGIQEKDAPAAIVEHVRLRERCGKPAGQGASRPVECDNLAAKTLQLRQQFASQIRWTKIIDRIDRVLGE